MPKPVGKLFCSNLNRWTYATWMSIDRNYLYVETPKVCCTTIKQVLQRGAGLKLPAQEQKIHYRNPSFEYVDSVRNFIDCVDGLIDRGLFVFAFTRSPYERLISAYRDKVLRSQGKFWNSYRESIRDLNGLRSDEEISFRAFINYVEDTPDRKRDIHWRSQAMLLRPDVIKYSFLGRFDSFREDLSKVLEILAIDPDLVPEGAANSTQEFSGPEVDATLAAEKQRIRDLYDIDYATFGYQ